MSEQTKILEDFNNTFGEEFSTYNELMDYLNEKFNEEVDRFDDVQEAYDSLNFDFHGFIGNHFVFFSSDSPWSVVSHHDIPKEKEKDAIESFNLYYSDNNSNIKDLTSALENKVMKAMSNVGCDPKSALYSILDDVGIDESLFLIDGFSGPYKLDIL